MVEKFNKFYKTANVFNFEQYGKNFRIIKFHGTSQKDLIQKYLDEFFDKVSMNEKTYINLNRMYENKKVDNEYDFGQFTQIWIYNPPKNILEIYSKIYNIADRGRFCLYYHMNEYGSLQTKKSCIVIELSGNHIRNIKNNYFYDIKKVVQKDIYERKVKDINHYAFFIKNLDTEFINRPYNVNYGQYDNYNNYEPVNEFELLDVVIPKDKRGLINRDWY